MILVNTDIIYATPISIPHFITDKIIISYIGVLFIIQKNNWPIF